jgi:hypothetical protein
MIVAETKIARAWPALTVGEGSEKNIHCENNLKKVNLILTSATADAENVALLTKVRIMVEHVIYSLEFSQEIAISWQMLLSFSRV